MRIDPPAIIVLMAVKDGLAYLPQQLESIFNQQQCHVTLLVSDDCSTDGSREYIQKCSEERHNLKLLPHGLAHGSAAKNFYRLIIEAQIAGFDYIAFADQDDIWQSDKLIRHIHLAQVHHADGVSSNVTAFWPDGLERLLDKAQPQRQFDYLFESAGPGCTFLMTPWLIGKLRDQLLDDNSPAKDVVFHDWLTYAVCRAHGRHWYIDAQPSIHYRQHQSNMIGANVGLGAKWQRLNKLQQKWYRGEVLKIATVCRQITANSDVSHLLNLLASKNLSARMQLLARFSRFRRKALDRWLLAGAILLGFF